MRTALFLLLAGLISIKGFASAPGKVNFFEGSITSAKSQAAAEGKLYFLDFMASWCMPCRWMDEITYTDAALSAYIRDNYIPVKVDIDDFDGFALKQQYNIKLLPTILIFNARGQLLGRYEESLAPAKMLQILQQYDLPENRTGGPVGRLPGTTAKPTPPPAVTRTAVNPSEQAPQPSQQIYRPALGRTKPNSQPTYSAVHTPSVTSPPVATGEELYRFSVRHQPPQGFSLQIGAFSEYGNVLREVANLEEKFEQSVIVHISQIRQKPVYKILIGSFATQAEAIEFQKQLRENKLVGLVKDLSAMK